MKKVLIMLACLLLMSGLATAKLPEVHNPGGSGGTYCPAIVEEQKEPDYGPTPRINSLPMKAVLHYPFGRTAQFEIDGHKCGFSYDGFNRYSQVCYKDVQFEVIHSNWHRSFVKIWVE